MYNLITLIPYGKFLRVYKPEGRKIFANDRKAKKIVYLSRLLWKCSLWASTSCYVIAWMILNLRSLELINGFRIKDIKIFQLHQLILLLVSVWRYLTNIYYHTPLTKLNLTIDRTWESLSNPDFVSSDYIPQFWI